MKKYIFITIGNFLFRSNEFKGANDSAYGLEGGAIENTIGSNLMKA